MLLSLQLWPRMWVTQDGVGGALLLSGFSFPRCWVSASNLCHFQALVFKLLLMERLAPAVFHPADGLNPLPTSFIASESGAQRGARLCARQGPELDLNPGQLLWKSEPVAVMPSAS